MRAFRAVQHEIDRVAAAQVDNHLELRQRRHVQHGPLLELAARHAPVQRHHAPLHLGVDSQALDFRIVQQRELDPQAEAQALHACQR